MEVPSITNSLVWEGRLHKKINTLLKTKSFNDIEVEKLKKEKLKLKDKIYSLVYKFKKERERTKVL